MALNSLNKCLSFATMAMLCSLANSQILVEQLELCTANAGNALSSRLLNASDVESADDFVVPENRIWRPNRIVSQGSRNIIGGQVRVNIYADKEVSCPMGQTCPESVPTGNPICTFLGTAEEDSENTQAGANPFAITLPENSCPLQEGRYWLSLTYANKLCGTMPDPPCEDWHWDESRAFNTTREWVIRDIGDTSAEVTCGNFNLGSACQSQPVADNLCFNLEGQSQLEQAPVATPELVVQTVLVNDSLALDLTQFINEPNDQALTFTSSDLPDFVTMNSAGGILIEPGVDDATSDAVSTITATDTKALSDDLLLALRIIDPETIGIKSPFNSDVLMRCGVGNDGLNNGLDFSIAGNCGDGPASACEPMPEGAVVINAQLEVQLRHPMVSDLALRLHNPAGTAVEVMNRPTVNENFANPTGGCDESNIHAVFSDTHTWSVEQQCTQPIGVVGDLEPKEPLAGFRNQLGVGNTPWILQIDNAGERAIDFTQWCLALQVEPTGAPIYPQAQLPGSGTLIDLRTEDEATITATLKGPEDIHWYLVAQTNPPPAFEFYDLVDTRITPAPGQILRSHRYNQEKFSGQNPNMAIGNCADSRELIYPRYEPTIGRELIRISGCGDNAAGSYTLNVAKNLTGFSILRIPAEVGTISGLVRDAVNGLPVPRAYITSSGSSAFAAADGNFDAAILVGTRPATIFHPDYLPLSFEATPVEGVRVDVGTLDLTPTNYTAVTNQIIFETGFE